MPNCNHGRAEFVQYDAENTTPACLSYGCKAGETAQMAAPTCVPDPYTRPNGSSAIRWQIGLNWKCIAASHPTIDLGIKKSVNNSPVPVGGAVIFTLTPFNNGPGTVGTGGVGAVVTDTLPASIGPPITASGMNWNCTIAGQNVTCTYVGPPVGPGQLLPKITIQGRAQTPGNWENCAGIKATGAADTVAGDDKACTPFVITGGPPTIDLGIKKSVNNSPVPVGGAVIFTLTPFNNGPGTVGTGGVGAVVTDTLPASIGPPITASGMNWNCTIAGQNVTCTYVGPPVGPGQLLPKITIQGRAQMPGNWENCAGIKATGAADTVAGDDKACTPFVITGGPPTIDLGIKKSVNNSPVPVGGAVIFTLTPFNNGPGTVGTGGVGAVVTDTLPASIGPPITASGMNWNCTVAGQNVTCTYVGPPVGPGQLLPKIYPSRAGPKRRATGKTVPASRAYRRRRHGGGRISPHAVRHHGGASHHRPRDQGVERQQQPGAGRREPVIFTLTPFNNGPGTVGTGGVGASSSPTRFRRVSGRRLPPAG